MTNALIINTSCLDPHAMGKANPHRGLPYGGRKPIVERNIRLANEMGWDEVIVAGVYEPGDGYLYVPVPPERRNRSDALTQREMGARYATAEVLTFCHDDHIPHSTYLASLLSHDPEWDLLVPKRTHQHTGEALNNGFEDDYMGGHCLSMRRWLWAQVPWTSTIMTYWDITMTRLWRDAGARIVWSDTLQHIDYEAREDEL